MDFLLCGDAAGINIEDMIEHDMKSDYCKDHLLDGSDPYLCAKPVLLSVSYNHVDDALNDSYSEDTKHSDHDASWLQQTVNVNEVHGIIAPENTDPNLLVNPQTGLPVSTSSQVTQTASLSPGLALGDGSQLGSLGNAIIQAATNNVSENISTLKFISANPSISPQSSPLKSPAIPISTKSSTVQQVTAQPTITYMPATPSTIQNVQKVSHSQSVSSVTYQTLTQHLQNTNSHPHKKAKLSEDSNRFPKPVYSYSCLIAMALKNSDTGALPVSEIYSFMTENFPYFKIAPDGWKNSVRHNLSLNKCFEKIENPKATSTSRKGCLWGLNPAKIEKMDEEIVKWRKKDPMAVKKSMQYPERLETIEKGNLGSHWPHHPNNIKNNYSSHDLSHIMQHSPAVGSPDSSVPSGSSSPGSAPSTPTKTNCVQVSLIEIRPDHAIRTVKLDPAQVIQTSNVLTNAINRASTMSQPIKIEPKIEVQNEMILIKNDPDVIKEEVNDGHDSSREEEDMNLSQTALMDHDIEFAHGIWDELQDEGINLDDLPSSSQFNFSFSTNSLTSSPATVLQV